MASPLDQSLEAPRRAPVQQETETSEPFSECPGPSGSVRADTRVFQRLAFTPAAYTVSPSWTGVSSLAFTGSRLGMSHSVGLC